jgi:hypothetical protein
VPLASSCSIRSFDSQLGCVNEQPRTVLSYSADAKRSYDAAMVEFNDHNWLEAAQMFREVKRIFDPNNILNPGKVV